MGTSSPRGVSIDKIPQRESAKIVIDSTDHSRTPTQTKESTSKSSKINYKNVLPEDEIYPKVSKILENNGNSNSQDQISKLDFCECKQLEYIIGCSMKQPHEKLEALRKAYI